MGQEVSSTRQMETTLYNMKFASRQLQNESKRCETKQKAEEKKVVEALQKGQTEVARIYASNAVREKTQSINFLKLASRMDAVCGRVENAIRMKTLTKEMGAVTVGMDGVLAGMDIDKIAAVMDKFEKQFDDLDVRAGYMDKAISGATSTAVPEDAVDDLIAQVAAKNALEFKDGLATAGTGKIVAPGGVGAAAAAPAAKVAEPIGSFPAAPTGDIDGKPKGGDGGASGGAGTGGGGGGGGLDSLAARLEALKRS